VTLTAIRPDWPRTPGGQLPPSRRPARRAEATSERPTRLPGPLALFSRVRD
jgi:hypothetical protein